MASTKNRFIRDTTDYSILPTHIITDILKYLTISDFKNATQVCKTWYYGSTDPYFIRKLCARITSNNFQPFLDYNQRYYSKFIVSDANPASEEIIRNFLHHYQQYVREIDFFYCCNTKLDRILNLYVKNLHNLDTLTIKSRKNLFSDDTTHLWADDLMPIANLKHLNLYTLCEFSNSDSVKNLITFLSGTQNLDTLEIHSKFDAMFGEFIETFQNLPYLSNLTALTLHVTKYQNFLVLLKNLLRINFKNLLTLQLYDSYHDSDEINFDVIARVEYCDLMAKFGTKFTNLRELYVGYASDEILKNIFKFMKNLKVLGLSCAHRIELKEIDIFTVIEKLQINIYTYNNPIVGTDRPIESNVLKIFNNQFPNLKELKVNGETNPETLKCIVQNCSNLEVLQISGLLNFYTWSHEIYDKLTRLKVLKLNNIAINRECTN